MLTGVGRAGSTIPKVLAIGGLDPSGGAGALIDAFSIANFGAFPYVAVTAITAQNSAGVLSTSPVDPDLLAKQIGVVMAEGGISAIKTGMIPTMDIALLVIEEAERLGVPLVIDPVLNASDGTPLFEGDLGVYAERFAAKATVLTPNVPEAEALSGRKILDESDMETAAGALIALGAKWVLLKGGHLEGEAVDLLVGPGVKRTYRAKKSAPGMRGTGCMLASSIAALLASGRDVEAAVMRARDFVKRMMESSEAIGYGALQAALHRARLL